MLLCDELNDLVYASGLEYSAHSENHPCLQQSITAIQLFIPRGNTSVAAHSAFFPSLCAQTPDSGLNERGDM